MSHELLSRNEFREAVFRRDGFSCVVCGKPAQDAHHIVERRLWPDGGYYLENGASLCGDCHLNAEDTSLSCEEIREKAGIKKVLLPPHLYRDQEYDKWGNPVLPNKTRLKGDLFFDESVQKILARSGALELFSDKVKYPRTYHLPWSPGVTKDDRIIQDLSSFEGQEVVVTVKMDGENTSLYSDYVHARSLEYAPHPSRDRVKAFHASLAHNIPQGWRVCGENLYAKHSILYTNLKDYFLAFSVWDDKNNCLSWNDTVEWCSLLEIQTVPVLYRGMWDEGRIQSLYREEFEGDECEGYVVRVASSFSYSSFRHFVAKFVRENHVQTQAFWLHKQIEKNNIASED